MSEQTYKHGDTVWIASSVSTDPEEVIYVDSHGPDRFLYSPQGAGDVLYIGVNSRCFATLSLAIEYLIGRLENRAIELRALATRTEVAP